MGAVAVSRPEDRGGRALTNLDLLVVAVLAVSTSVVGLWLPDVLPTPFRVVLGFLFIFVLPGYAATAALYPTMYRQVVPATGISTTAADSQLFGTEIAVLTVGLSLFSVPLPLLSVTLLGFDIGPGTTFVLVTAVTVVCSIAAVLRRARAPSEGAGVPVAHLSQQVTSDFRAQFSSGPTIGAVTIVLLLAAAGVASATLISQPQGETYTEFSLLTIDDETGNLTADGYPTSVTVGDPQSVVVSVTNREGAETNYTVVVEQQRLGREGDIRQVQQSTTVDRFSLTLANRETERRNRSIEVSRIPGPEESRLAFLLYRGDPPERPSIDSSYRHTYFWVNVTG
ncbi:DUF1616 domain-containing protein [Haloarcula salina]|uniref:DUF1616 domain-containing protein n=1 Tax=Haloarcula salina TaxID=1429914 RepID=A0AA41G1W3_9EURY|nr:DUF1616 domain-containing protein [Haloarcula salina]MBV0902721.1 DUF1616 domain-containing protein [Haloarcula salina]